MRLVLDEQKPGSFRILSKTMQRSMLSGCVYPHLCTDVAPYASRVSNSV